MHPVLIVLIPLAPVLVWALSWIATGAGSPAWRIQECHNRREHR